MLIRQRFMVEESHRLSFLSTKIKSNSNNLYQYVLDIQNLDDILKKRQKDYYTLVNNKGKRINTQRRNKKLKLINFIQLGIAFANLFFLLMINILTIDSLQKYLHKQKNTGQMYSSLSNSGVDVLIIYAQREVLYRIKSFQFLSTQDIQDIYDQIDTSLNQIRDFTQQFIYVNSQDYLLDENSIKLFHDSSIQSICNFLPKKYVNVSRIICPQVLNGVLNKGLISTLNMMQTSISTERQFNNFTSRSIDQIPIKELEGATLTAWVIQELKDNLEQNLKNYSIQLQLSYQCIYGFAISFQLIFCFFLVFLNSKYEIEQIRLLKRIVYIMPQTILLFDDTFQRQVKAIIKQEESQ